MEPTIVQTTDPTDRIMSEEIFGPVLSIFVYPDAQVDEMLTVANKSTPFALTGAIFAQDEWVIRVLCLLFIIFGYFFLLFQEMLFINVLFSRAFYMKNYIVFYVLRYER